MITLFGATGYTGKKIARCLARDGLSFRIAGRSQEKLRALSQSLPNQPEWLIADAMNPNSLPPLFQGTRLLINATGPFTDLGERVVSLAAVNGSHYLDTTNELGFVFRLRSYDQMAKRSGAALVPACAFEVALADCMVNRLAAEIDQETGGLPLDEVNVVYAISGFGISSAGTRRSAVRSLATSWLAYRNGDWVGQGPTGDVKRFDLPVPPNGSRRGNTHDAIAFPSSETVTLPAHVRLQNIHTWMTTGRSTRFWAPVLVPLVARFSGGPLRKVFTRLAAVGGVGMNDQGQQPVNSPFSIYVMARGGGRSKWMVMHGNDPYVITAEIAAYAACQISQPDYNRSGLLAPAQALSPDALIAYAKENWAIELVKGKETK
jgi:short subunit dehydrogenase-like uncharacterized protein